MESHMLNKLVEKFWNGECSEQEEQMLIQAIREKESEKDFEELQEYLEFLHEERNTHILGEDFDTEILEKIDRQKVKRIIPATWTKVAAAVIFLASFSFGIKQLMSPRPQTEISQVEDTYEDTELALAEVQKALLLLSTNMNEGIEPARLLGEFDKAKKELKSTKQEKTDESN